MSTIDLGTYTEGSIPPPLVVTFEDESGAPLDLTNFESGKFEMQRFGQVAVERDAAISTASSGATKGQGTYVWLSGDMAAGTWLGEMWAIDSTTNREVSRKLTWFVEPAVRVPA
jgi:hypothetical protein